MWVAVLHLVHVGLYSMPAPTYAAYKCMLHASFCCCCCLVQRVLSAYAGELLKRLPKTAAGGTSAQPPYLGTDWHVRLPQEEEEVLASILATAEYCRCVG